MKECIFLFVILNICPICTLHSQWLEKEGYWELSEKIPDLRDLKILPEENLIITVSKDNTIRHIEYDSGKILKTQKPEGIPDSNDYAKISSDGKTTVVARYKDGNTFTDINVSIIDNYELNVIATGIFPNGLENFNSVTKEVLELKVTYCESYNKDLVFSNYVRTNGSTDMGRYFTNGVVGNTFIATIANDSIGIDKKFSYYAPIELIKFQNQKLNFLAQIGYYSHSYSGSREGGLIHSNALTLFDKNFDTTMVFKSEYSSSSRSNGQGSDSFNESGYLFPMNQLFESNTDSILIIIGDGKLYNFNLNQKNFLDSITNNIFKSNVFFIRKNEFVGQLNLKKYTIYGKLNLRKLEEFALPNDLLLPYPIIDEKNNKTIFALKDQSIIFISFDFLDDLSSKGFYWNKDSIYVGESISFKAITNLEGCTFEWLFSNGDIINSETNEIAYKFSKQGIYGVTLIVTKPDGEKISFIKDSIITVMEIVNANFEVTELNSELPLEVQFTDKSTGNIKSWNWDFGDGNTSTEFNPLHEYKYQGDFSVKLIVSDSLDSDTLIKYEELRIGTPLPSVQFAINTILTQKSISEFKNAYIVDGGFIYTSYYYDITTRNRNEILYDYSNRLVFNHFDQNLFFLKKDTIDCGKNEVPFFPKPTSLEVQLNDYLFAIDAKFWEDTYKMIYDSKINKMVVLKEPRYPAPFIKALILKSPTKDNIFSVFDINNNPEIIVFDLNYDVKSELNLPIANNVLYLADTILGGLDLFAKKWNNAYTYFSISPENTLNYEKSFSLNTNITLTNIKSVHDNLILLHGYYTDKVNKTTYAYFAKYHPLDNTLQDTILYSRKDIRKLERVNNSTYAAIGQSRGRQGYLLLDTNLHQIKDIRVDSLTGEIKDLLLLYEKVYLFTEKIVSLETTALGVKESYQTTASVLGLPEDIIATVADSPIIFTDKLTHFAYPNPTSEVLNLKVATNESANYTIKLYDILGTETLNIHDGFIPAHTEKIFNISTSALSIGSYYYLISCGGLLERGKVMVVR